jgi:uncharacterized glyoxalase superfamily protein PhnB
MTTDGIEAVLLETHNWGKNTQFGTREMTVRDPEGRVWSLQAPLG